MDASSETSVFSLTPTEIKALIQALQSGQMTSKAIAERIATQGLLLSSDAEILFTELFKQGGATAANIILDHLSMLRFGYTSTSSAKYLCTLLLDYADDSAISRKLLAWFPASLDIPAVFSRMQLEEEEDLRVYQDLLLALAREPEQVANHQRISQLLIKILETSPGWIGVFFSALQSVQTELELELFLNRVTENELAKQAMFEQLPLLSSVSRSWSRLVLWVLRTYPERRLEALEKLLEQHRMSSYAIDDTLALFARELTKAELSSFLHLIERQRRQENWPVKVVVELVHNPRLSLEELVNSRQSLTLYRNILHQLSFILDRQPDEGSAFNQKQLFKRLIEDVHFSQLDESMYRSLQQEMFKRATPTEAQILRTDWLDRVDFKFAQIFERDFFEGLAEGSIDPFRARRLIEKIIRHGTYPFGELHFLVQLLEAADEETFNNLILRYGQALFISEEILEEFYLAVATELPERFAPLYAKHRKEFVQFFGKQSGTDKEIYELCSPYLDSTQRLRGFFS